MLSRTLKKLRKNCGYTQKEVAKELGVDRSTYAYYETGKTTPDTCHGVHPARSVPVVCP